MCSSAQPREDGQCTACMDYPGWHDEHGRNCFAASQGFDGCSSDRSWVESWNTAKGHSNTTQHPTSRSPTLRCLAQVFTVLLPELLVAAVVVVCGQRLHFATTVHHVSTPRIAVILTTTSEPPGPRCMISSMEVAAWNSTGMARR